MVEYFLLWDMSVSRCVDYAGEALVGEEENWGNDGHMVEGPH